MVRSNQLSVVKQPDKSEISSSLQHLKGSYTKAMTLDEAKVFLSNVKKKYMGKFDSSLIPDLIDVEKVILHAKCENNVNIVELDMMLFDTYALMNLPAIATSIINNFCYREIEYELDDISGRLLEKADKDIGSLTYIQQSQKTLEAFEKYNQGHHWAALANVAASYSRRDQIDASYHYSLKSYNSLYSTFSTYIINNNSHLQIPEFYLGDLLYRKGQLDEKTKPHLWKMAQRNLLNVKKYGYIHTVLFEELGSINAHKGNIDEAIDDLDEAVLLDQENTDAWLLLCDLNLKDGLFEEAKECLEYAREIDPHYRTFKKMDRKYKLAIRASVSHESYKKSKKSPYISQIKKGLLSKDSFSLFKIFDREKINHIERTETQRAVDAKALINTGITFMQKGIKTNDPEFFNLAETTFLMAKDINDSLEVSLALFELYYHMGFYPLCLDILESCELDNLLPKEERMLNVINDIASNPMKFHRHAKKVTETFPNHWASLLTLGVSYKFRTSNAYDRLSNSELLDCALINVSESRRMLDFYHGALFTGKKNYTLNRHINKENYLTKKSMLRLYKNTSIMGFIYSELGEIMLLKADEVNKDSEKHYYRKKAEQHYDMALNLGYNSNSLFSQLGYLKNHLGKNDQAFKLYEEITKTNPLDINAWINLGGVCISLDNKAKAYECLKQAISIYEQYKVDFDKEREKQISFAIASLSKLYKDAYEKSPDNT